MEYRVITDYEEIKAGISLWNQRDKRLKIRNYLVRQNILSPFCGVNVVALGGFDQSELISFMLLKYLTKPIKEYVGKEQGWISLMVSKRGHGEDLRLNNCLLTAEKFLRERGISKIRFGGDPQNFLPGLPSLLKEDYLPIFKKQGYRKGNIEFDLYQDLNDFESTVKDKYKLSLNRVEEQGKDILYNFLDDNFAGRWSYEAHNIGQIPGGINDYWLLWYKEKPVGFVRENTSQSIYQGPNVNWGTYWGNKYCGIGPLGIASPYRKRGWGIYMLSNLLTNLKERGYRHSMIDWTTLVDYYQKLGFNPFIRYITLTKTIS